MELSKLIKNYKNEHNQDNYNKILLNIFSDIDKTLILPSKVRKQKNGFDLKSTYDSSGGMYLVAYTGKSFSERTDEAFISITIRGIIDKVLSDDKCLGICINPDLEIDDSNMMNQCIIPKEHIVKILNS